MAPHGYAPWAGVRSRRGWRWDPWRLGPTDPVSVGASHHRDQIRILDRLRDVAVRGDEATDRDRIGGQPLDPGVADRRPRDADEAVGGSARRLLDGRRVDGPVVATGERLVVQRLLDRAQEHRDLLGQPLDGDRLLAGSVTSDD